MTRPQRNYILTTVTLATKNGANLTSARREKAEIPRKKPSELRLMGRQPSTNQHSYGCQVLLAVRTGLAKGPARLVSWRLFSYKAPEFLSQNYVEWDFIQSLKAKLGNELIFTMDRGFGRFTLLGQMVKEKMRFVVRLKQDLRVD